jgi:integrase
VTDTTSPTRKSTPRAELTRLGAAPGVDQPGGPGTRYRVRLRFPGSSKPHVEWHAELARANARYWELIATRAADETPNEGAAYLTLGEAASQLLAAKRVANLTEGGVEWWVRILRPLINGPHAATPVHLLPAGKLHAAYLERAAKHPKAANDERIGLEATLRHAIRANAKVPQALLEWDPIEWDTLERVALTPDELERFAHGAPAGYVRLLLLQGTIGCRIGELLTLQRGWIDWTPGAETITIPAKRHKSGKRLGAKQIPLFPTEVELLREQLYPEAATASATSQLPSTPASSELVFPAPNGAAWPTTAGRVAGAYFTRYVWDPTLAAAATPELAGIRAKLALVERDRLTSHDLRATAITIMRDRGVSIETCALRVGHADGKLIAQVYDKGSQLERARIEIRAHVVAAATDTTTTATTREATR